MEKNGNSQDDHPTDRSRNIQEIRAVARGEIVDVGDIVGDTAVAVGRGSRSVVFFDIKVILVSLVIMFLALAVVAYWIFIQPCSWNDPKINELVPYHTNIAVNGTTIITADATDRDDDPLTYIWSAARGKVSAGNQSEQIQYTAPSTIGHGTDIVSVTVSDGKGGICKESITLTIQNAP